MSFNTTKKLAKDAGETVTALRQDIGEAARTVGNEAEKFTNSTVREVKGQVADVMQAAKTHAGEFAETADKMISEASRNLKTFVNEKSDVTLTRIAEEAKSHPLRTVGIAALAGLVIGALMSR